MLHKYVKIINIITIFPYHFFFYFLEKIPKSRNTCMCLIEYMKKEFNQKSDKSQIKNYNTITRTYFTYFTMLI